MINVNTTGREHLLTAFASPTARIKHDQFTSLYHYFLNLFYTWDKGFQENYLRCYQVEGS